MTDLPALAGSHEQHVDERVWRAAPWHTRPVLGLPGSGTRVLVVSAHPDDEVLALGGTLARLHASGCLLTLVSATDGERSHPASSAISPDELAERRSAEMVAALDALGIDVVPQRLGLPDSGLSACEPQLEELLAPLAAQSDLVVGTWSGDAHPDHEVVGRVCRRLAGDTPVWELPVWAWHWATPQDARFPWDRVHVVDIRDRLEAKCRAVDSFASQVLPVGPSAQDAAVLPPEVLAHFSRPFEVVLV